MGIFRFFVCLFLLLLSLVSFASDIDLETGLVAHYKFDGDFTDSSGTGNHGSQSGGVNFLNGIYGQAAYFDGSNDIVTVPHSDSLALDQNLSISLWVKPEYRDPDSIWGDTTIILIKNNHVGNNYSLWTERDAHRFAYQQFPASSAPRYTFSVDQPILSDDFVNIVVVRGSNHLKIYLNGDEVYTEDINYNAQLGSLPLSIGGGNVYNKYKGYIDDIRIYNRALTQTEVMHLVSPDDIDLDGLPNDHETANGLNPVDASDAQSDSDMDGLTALEEYNLGTSPTNDDTDRDTLPDGWEVENGRDPLKADYQIVSGGSHSCALTDSGVTCWGDNTHGQIDVPAMDNPSQIALGAFHSCAINDSGVSCWGINVSGETNVPVLDNPSKIIAGHSNTCALDHSGWVCWGLNDFGQSDVDHLNNPTQIALGQHHSCAIDNGEIVCWGQNSHGELDVPPLLNSSELYSGDQNLCAVTNDEVECWGRNSYGEINLSDLVNPTDLSLSGHHTCAFSGGNVLCWGYNNSGQIEVPELINPKQVSVGHYHSCALDERGVSCWGDNSSGQSNVPSLVFDPDGDGFSNQDKTDVFPFDNSEWLDTDMDGIGDNTDLDDDGDGIYEEQNFSLEALKANFSSPHRPLVHGNDQLEIGTSENSPYQEILWRIPVLDNGYIDESDEFKVTIEIEEVRFPGLDRDFVVGISDGSKVVNFANAGSGYTGNWIAEDMGDRLSHTTANSNNFGDDHTHYSATFAFTDNTCHLTFTDLISNNQSEHSIQLESGTFDRSKGLELVLIGNEADENFVIKALSITYPDIIDSDGDGIVNPDDTDDDNDGLNDDLELHHGLDPLVANTVNQEFCNLPDDNLIAWWDGEGTTTDRVSGLVGNPLRGWTDSYFINYDPIDSIGFAEGKFGDAFSFSGDGDHLDFGPIQAFQPPNLDSITLSAWVYRKGPSSFHREANSHIIAGRAGLRGDGTSTHGGEYLVLTDDVVAFSLNDSTGADIAVYADGLIDNQWHHLVGIFDANTKVISIYVNGVLIEAKTANGYIPSNNTTWKIGASSHWSSLQAHNGYIDELQVFNKALTSNEVLSLTAGCYYLDNDNDGVLDYLDAFPDNVNENIDSDGDGIGNNSDTDDDNDGFEDTYEIANNLDPLIANLDIDNDGIANHLDTDNDNDGIEDGYDAFPIDSTEHLDTDLDGIGNNTDVDDDGDGVSDALDLFPWDSYESADSDGDGVGDNADFFPNSAEYSLDSDLDQMPDTWERKYGLNPTDASDALLDQDNDGLTALEEYEAGTIPLKILDIDANGNVDALTDGLIILRYLFNLRGDNLVNGAVAENAMRADAADVEAYIQSLMPDF